MAKSRTIIVERIAYKVFRIHGGKLLKTWARIGTELKPITATTDERLRKKLRQVSVNLLNGETEAAALESSDHRSYLAARESLVACGITVDAAAREYAAARAILGATSLIEAVRFFQLHSGQVIVRKSLGECVDEFIFSLLPRSKSYREISSYDLERLLRSVPRDRWIDDVTTAELERAISETGRTIRGSFNAASDYRRNQVRGLFVTFFNWARARKYLPRKLDTVAHELVAEEIVSEAREVWDPEHLRRAFEIVSAHERVWLPWTAISALANVRSMGTRRLAWSDVHWLDDLIELKARKSKIKRRTTVPIGPVLASWLEPFRGERGLICPSNGFGDFIKRLKQKYELPYYKNILRRSYITYLLAETDDEEYVALVANTSVAKLRENYRQIRTFSGRLVTKELATAWFGTARISAANVVQLELRA